MAVKFSSCKVCARNQWMNHNNLVIPFLIKIRLKYFNLYSWIEPRVYTDIHHCGWITELPYWVQAHGSEREGPWAILRFWSVYSSDKREKMTRNRRLINEKQDYLRLAKRHTTTQNYKMRNKKEQQTYKIRWQTTLKRPEMVTKFMQADSKKSHLPHQHISVVMLACWH